MLREGAVGLVSPNCVGPKSEYSVLMTANAGSPCRGGAYLKEFYDWNEALPDGTKAGDTYFVRTGHRARPCTAVFLGIGQALRDEAKLDPAPARIGALGDAVHSAGFKTAVSGNADCPPDVVDRCVAALAMDSRGIVDAGRLSYLGEFPNRPSNEFEATGLRSPPLWTGSALTPTLSPRRGSTPRPHADPLPQERGQPPLAPPWQGGEKGRTPPHPSPRRGGSRPADRAIGGLLRSIDAIG